VLGLAAGAFITDGVVSASPAAAASAGNFDPGYIISDSQFYDGSAMTATEIQAFLDAKIGSCLNSKCLNVAVLPVADRAASYSGDSGNLACAAIKGGNLRVSELIYRTQVACNISAKVILVTLQKEQSLVTSRNPSDAQLRKAMGQGCPDTAPCDNSFAGLGLQIMSGARQLSVYKAALPRSSFRFKEPGVYNIAYTTFVDSVCTAPAVYVRNYATLALYNYTPYQPNAAALRNLYGAGDGCSSYGNRNFWVYYSDWFGSPVEVTPKGVTVTRIGGTDRYEVAAGISAATFTPGVPVAYIASGEDFPDAISAGPAAGHEGGPVLLVQKNLIPATVASELRRLAPARIVVVGGPATVSDSVLGELADYSAEVKRIGGADRYEVSRALASESFGGSSIAYIATGAVFADALSSGAAAGNQDAPVLLVNGQLATIDDATWATLQELGVTRVRVAGGPGSVSDGVYDSLVKRLGAASVERFGGSDRYAVSSAVNRSAFSTAGTFFVASGLLFPDALSATPAAVAAGAPLYITRAACADRAMLQHVIDAKATKMVIVGGPASVSDAVARFANC
jgi:putative cell wall-binding protein